MERHFRVCVRTGACEPRWEQSSRLLAISGARIQPTTQAAGPKRKRGRVFSAALKDSGCERLSRSFWAGFGWNSPSALLEGPISMAVSAAEVAIPSLLSLCAIQKLRMPCHLDSLQLTLI